MSVITSFLDAQTLSPPLVAACDGELVVFTCTVNGRGITWRITTPTRNYDPQVVLLSDVGRMPFRSSDGVFKFAATSYTTSPMELVSTLTTTVNTSFDLQCQVGDMGRSVTANLTLIRNFNNNLE